MTRKCLTLAVLGGMLAWCGVEPLRFWPCTLLCLAPLLALCIDCAPRSALFRGFLSGLALNVALFYWFVPLLHRFAGLPWVAAVPAGLGLIAWQSIPFALLGGVIAWSRRPLIAAPAALVALEFFWPTLFPWHVGFPLGRAPLLVQAADLVGTGIASLLCGLTSAAVAVGLKQRTLAPAVTLAVLGLLVPGYGVLRMHQVDAARAAAPRLRVGVVQPNAVSLRPEGRDEYLARLRAATTDLERRGAEIVVWPECAYPHYLDPSRVGDYAEGSDWRIGPVTVPLVFGARIGRRSDYANSVLLLLPNGRLAARYDKIHLVAFSEKRPLNGLLGRLWDHFPRMLQLSAGTEPAVFDAAGTRLGPLVCVEDLVPSAGRSLVRRGAEVFVNLTNDTWFGTTHGPRHHLASSVFRAIETRRDLVRCTAAGISAHIDATGRLLAESGLHDVEERAPVETFLFDAARLEGITPAVRLRDAFPWTCGALALMLVLRRRGRCLRLSRAG